MSSKTIDATGALHEKPAGCSIQMIDMHIVFYLQELNILTIVLEIYLAVKYLCTIWLILT